MTSSQETLDQMELVIWEFREHAIPQYKLAELLFFSWWLTKEVPDGFFHHLKERGYGLNLSDQ